RSTARTCSPRTRARRHTAIACGWSPGTAACTRATTSAAASPRARSTSIRCCRSCGCGKVPSIASRPARGVEAATWYYLRVSGLAMVAFAFGHLLIMHYQRAPVATGAAFVAGRWAGPAWRVFDGVLLLLALSHGVAGAYGMLR